MPVLICQIAACSFGLRLAGGTSGAWSASMLTSRESTAHRMRAFLFARATPAFCQPARSLSCTSYGLMRSLRLPAVITALVAPWINSVRR